MAFGKAALFIDGVNLYYTAKSLGLDLDFKRLLTEFERRCPLLRAYYYTTVFEEAEFQTTRPLIDWLDYNGFTVRVKAAKEVDDGEGRRKFKRNVAVELAVDALEIANYVDKIVLFRATAIFGQWSKPCSDAAFTSPWSLRCGQSRQWPPMNCEGRRILSSSFMISEHRSVGRRTVTCTFAPSPSH